MEQSLLKVLDEVHFSAIADGRIWEIERDHESVLAEAKKRLDSNIADLASRGIASPEEINFFLERLIVRLYAGIFHLIMQNSSADEKLDFSGNFKWAPVKKGLARAKSKLRIIKEYMEIHARKDPGLRFSLDNGVNNIDNAISCVNHVLTTHQNRANIG